MNTIATTAILPWTAGIVLLVALIVFVAVRARARREYGDWEARMLADAQGIALNTARQVVSDQTTLEKLDAQAWQLADQHGLTFAEAVRLRDNETQISSSLTRTRQPVQAQAGVASGHAQFPFTIKPVRQGQHTFDLREMLSEPAAYINASLASVWFYSDGAEITHAVLAGHANGIVCRHLTALLLNTYLGMEGSDDTMLVPGACVLRGPAGASRLEVRPPAGEANPYLTSLLFPTAPDKLQRLPGDFEPFERDTGLARAYAASSATYWQVYDRIVSQIDACNKKRRDVLLHFRNDGHPPCAMYIPFFILGADNLKPLSIDVPLALFESAEFAYLKEVHQRSLLLELTGDAQRRKRIYEEWLNNDEQAQKRYRQIYAGMSPEERQAKKVQISGSRDYLTATIKKPSADGKEVFISPEEHFTKNLPGLIEADKHWIAEMERLINQVQQNDKSRDERLEEINAATLVDSFLRGWSSVFLSGDEARQKYEGWCEAKRPALWGFIHRQLRTRGLRMEPLQEENTVFRVQFPDSQTVRLTPLHLVVDQDALIYLSPRYGLTYYVDNWARRSLDSLPVPTDNDNAAMAINHCRQAAGWLDRATPIARSLSLDEAVRRGAEELILALEYHPLIAVHELWNAWWSRCVRDTSREFQVFKDLMKGLKAYFEQDYQTASGYFEQFITTFPDHLPDPYLLLAFQGHSTRYGLVGMLAKHREAATRRTELVEAHNSKLDYLKSNEGLMAKLRRPGAKLTSGDVSQVNDVRRVSDEVATLRAEIQHLDDTLVSLGREIESSRDLVWTALATDQGQLMHKARELGSAHVDKVVSERQLSLSEFYWQRFRPLQEILKADEYIHIADTLASASQALGKKTLGLAELREKADSCLQVQYVNKDELKLLSDFRQKLDAISEADSLIRELVLRKEIDEIAQGYFKQGLQQYEESAYLLPEFSEPVKRLSALYSSYRFQYRKSLQTMTQGSVVLRNFAPAARFVLVDRVNWVPNKIWYDPTTNQILAQASDHAEAVLARVDGLTKEETEHLISALQDPGFIRRPALGMSTAERVLNRQIALSPEAQRWGFAIRQLESWLIRVIAYVGILPIAGEPLPSAEVMKHFSGRPAVHQVRCDADLTRVKFLQELGLTEDQVETVYI